MAPAPAPEQGFQNFSAPTPAPFDLNFAGSGSAKYFDHCKTKKLAY